MKRRDCPVNRQQMIRSLKTFQRMPNNDMKTYFLCQCEKDVIQAFTHLFSQVLKKEINFPKSIKSQLKPLKFCMERLASNKTKTKQKKKILSNIATRQLLFPLLKKHIIPLGLQVLENQDK